MSRLACVAVVKDEAPDIDEWIAYQLAVGFDTVILYDNASTDGTAEHARAFSPSHDVRVIDWPETGNDYQTRAYEHAVREFGGEFAWMAFFDTDEFLVLAEPFELRDLLGLLQGGDAAAIAVPWAIFGSAGHIGRPEGLVTESFTRRAPAAFGPNRHVKSIIRPQKMIRCRNPHVFEMEGLYRDLSGVALNFEGTSLLAEIPDYTMGKLHHYFTRSRAHWERKLRRGYHNIERRNEEFENYDRNEIGDMSATRYFNKLQSLNLSAKKQNNKIDNLEILENVPAVVKKQRIEAEVAICITTLNRADILNQTLDAIKKYTKISYVVFVADDGSSDDTVSMLKTHQDVYFFSGNNKGVAWNKNRCIFFARNFTKADTIILLDDDTRPTAFGWEENFVAGAARFGHVNLAFPDMQEMNPGRSLNSDQPGLVTRIGGVCISYSNFALNLCGYFDSRFKKYGREHSEFSKRLLRAGFGGIQRVLDQKTLDYFFVVKSSLTIAAVKSNGDPAAVEENGQIWQHVVARDRSVYRLPWCNDEEKVEFLGEQRSLRGHFEMGLERF